MPATSEARRLASIQNGRKGSGPRSPQSKEISRRNGLKHGLSGAGVVLADCDAPEVERRTEDLMAELDPRSALGKLLVGKIATFSVRMERASVEGLAISASKVRHAIEAFDHQRIDRAEDLFDTLADDPRKHLRLLKRMPEGVDRLIEAWGELRGELTRPDGARWDASLEALAISMLGLRPGQVGAGRLEGLSEVARGEASPADLGGPTLDGEPARAWARARLVELIDEQVAALATHRATLDLATLDLDRDEAPARVSFDTSAEGIRLRRYESEASRMFFKALKEYRQAEAEAAERPVRPEAPKPRPEPAPVAVPVPAREPARSTGSLGSSCEKPSGSLGSSWEKTSSAAREPEPTRFEGRSLPIGRFDGQARGLDGRVVAIGRAAVVPG